MVVDTIKILILGAQGMLGHALQREFPSALPLGHAELDIANRREVMNAVRQIQPEIILNAAAYTNVDACETQWSRAISVNAQGPANLAYACRETGAMLVHYSTDYVFNGQQIEYDEHSLPDPINTYGKSKLIGEKNINRLMADYRIIRTSRLFGPDGRNFVQTMLSLAKHKKPLRVINTQTSSPTYTVDLARQTKIIIDSPPGIYHATNDGACTRYEFAKAITPMATPSDTLSGGAPRPERSVLANTKTSRMRPWREALKEYTETL